MKNTIAGYHPYLLVMILTVGVGYFIYRGRFEMKEKIANVCGWMLMLSLSISVISAFSDLVPVYWAGIPVWLASCFLLPSLKTTQKRQIFILLGVGLAGLLFGLLNHADFTYIFKAMEANQKVINMLIGVGFLKIFATENIRTQESLPKGKGALLRTLLGTHLFGAVLNMSSVIIVGDRLASQSRVTPLQGILLLRAFCICAFWSPFFAAMGLALLSSPGAQLSTLVLYGIPISIAGIAFSAWEITRQPDVRELHGYPIAIHSLWMPCLLAFIVIGMHEWQPQISVLTLVTLTAIIFTFIWLMTTHGIRGLFRFRQHIESGIAGSAGEVVLFAAAALLAAGVAATLSSLNIQLAPTHFGPMEASITVLILVGLAMTGMHPVTSVVLAGSLLSPSVSDPNLLGMTLLMGWSLGIGLSPFSGVQLSIQSRYEISAISLLKMNWRYAITMLFLCFALLWFYTFHTGGLIL
ncbi:hypothetical protein [Vibrio mangrovi]|uniref:Inner membrane protein YbhI n=1 Tax=Vibrio mangrovi TaxID=474394 RepID=A0ABU4I876_9VIBR|nr:hypothetical protein [Vibrio mangrovi]MDW6004155.1 hypothetical protein [Vibrio mangrovi]